MAGVIIGNRYELLEKIGSGGMAIVYKARCRLLNRFVAVKMLRPEFNDDVEFLKRFETEAQAAAALSHPNIVSVYDVGTHDRIHYIVMEYVEGVTLKEFLSDTGPLPIEKIVDFSSQIASALEHAHAKKIIHHDIKPHNIIITESGLLKVTDFGLARAVSASTTVASAGAIGSVHYASPEQARGGFTDAKSDIYSLGITMYEMTTGHVPFDGDTPVSIAIKHLQKEPTPPSEIAPDIPHSLERIILKCIEKEPSKRYQNAGDIIEDLKTVLNNDGVVYKNEGDEEKFSTRRMPTPEDIKREGEKYAAEQTAKPKEEQPPIPEPGYDAVKDTTYGGKKKKKKEDVIATIAAIATTLLIAAVVGLILFKVYGLELPFLKQKVEVPSFIGMTLEEAEKEAKKNKIEINTQYDYDDETEEGKIFRQDPEEGKKIKEGDEVTVWISSGPEPEDDDDKKIKIPPIGKDQKFNDYKDELIELGVKEENINRENEENDDVKEGCVIRTDPEEGKEITSKTKITVYVSGGSEKVTVPNLAGMTVDGAGGMLEGKELSLGNVEYRESDKPAGTVIEQSPTSGSKAIKGSSVNLVVSKEKEPEPTPSLQPKPETTTETTDPELTETGDPENGEQKTSKETETTHTEDTPKSEASAE